MVSRVPIGALCAAALSLATLGATAQETETEAPPPPPAVEPAEADAPEPPTASRADVLFEQGLKDMLAGNYERGCPALAESYQLDPLPGGLFTLAECENKQGKLLDARAHYQGYIDQIAGMPQNELDEQGERPDVAKKQLGELARRTPALTLSPPEDAPPGVTIQRNGDAVSSEQLGRAIALDPGEQVVVVRAPGHHDNEQRIALAEGDRKSLQLEVGREIGGTSGSSMRTAAFVAGGVGLAGLLVGAIAGGVALGQSNTIDEECDEENACSQEGLDAVDTGQAAGVASTVGFAIGGVGVAAAVLLFLLAPDDDEPEASGAWWDGAELMADVQLSGASVRVAIPW